MVRQCVGKKREPEPEPEVEPEVEVEATLISLHVRLPARLTGHRPARKTLAEIAAGARRELTCAGLGSGWGRRANEMVGLHCNIVAADPPMADGPLLNSAELRGCAYLTARRFCRVRTCLTAPCMRWLPGARRNVALIQRGGVSFGDKAALAVAAGAVGIIFVNDSGEMIAPQLEQGRDPAELSHVPAICITKLVGERLSKLLQSHQILRNLPNGSGYDPACDNAHVHIRWWDITSGWAARRIQKQWKRAVAQRQIERRILEQNALIAEEADRLWQRTKEAAVAEAEAELRESESLRKAARPHPTRGHNPRLPVEPETISQQQQRLAHEDVVLSAQIASVRAMEVGGRAETVMQRNKREKAERRAAEKRSKAEAKSRRQWIGSLPFDAIEQRHALLAKRIDASKGGLDRIEQLQRTVSLREHSLREKDATITALQREVALARLRNSNAA